MATFKSMKKKRMAQIGAAGIREMALGYTMNTKPGPKNIIDQGRRFCENGKNVDQKQDMHLF